MVSTSMLHLKLACLCQSAQKASSSTRLETSALMWRSPACRPTYSTTKFAKPPSVIQGSFLTMKDLNVYLNVNKKVP